MSARLEVAKVSPEATRGLTELERYARQGPVEPYLAEMVRVRVSQINGCAYCLRLHSDRARRAGVAQPRLDLLSAWKESGAFSDKERAALLWAETLTLLAGTGAPDSIYDEVRPHFSDRELVDLTMVIATINAWNRIQVGFRVPPPAPDLRSGVASAADLPGSGSRFPPAGAPVDIPPPSSGPMPPAAPPPERIEPIPPG